MRPAPTTIVDLSRLNLSHGEGKRIELPVRLEPFELGGQSYVANPVAVAVRLEISRPSGGFAFRIQFPVHLEGPCVRCLEQAQLDLEVEAREVNASLTDDEELRSPYVEDDQLDIGRWAHDATILALPTPILCRPDCLGLCPTCGVSLNDADPADHQHE
ncbi:MAG: DUF177 domain-containing protein, partial [Solirubrobacterales bacterium]